MWDMLAHLFVHFVAALEQWFMSDQERNVKEQE